MNFIRGYNISNLIDLTGQHYGRWTVLYRVPNKNGNTYWHCRCDCGTEKDVNASNLRRGLTTSCGCYRDEQISKATPKKQKYSIKPGDKFNQLTVLKELDNGMILCRCDCGNEVEVYRTHLASGHKKTCGCRIGLTQYNLINEIGNRYGRLEVIDYAGRDYRSNALWRCKCDCGNETIVGGVTLRMGNTKSCGCLRSKGELLIENLLKEHNIHFKKEFSFEDLYVNNGKAKFDFAILNDNEEVLLLIEYQGIQHFQDTNFGRLQREVSDNLKREYCKDHNIKLIEIPYTDYEKIDWDYLKERCSL